MSNNISNLLANIVLIGTSLLLAAPKRFVALPLGHWPRSTESVYCIAGIAGLFSIHTTNISFLFTEFRLPPSYLALIVGAIFAPLAEEIIFRGLLWHYLSRFLPSLTLVAVITSTLFAAIHLLTINQPWFLVFFPNLLYGLCIAGVRQATGGIAGPVLLHAGFNGIGYFHA